MMEVSSESDSDDCHLYTKAAKNISIKQKKLKSKLEEFDKVIQLASEDEVENILREVNVGHSPSNALVNTLYAKAPVGSTESDDEIPLATLRRSLRNKGKRKRPNQSQQKAKSKCKSRSSNTTAPPPEGARDLDVIVLDDDTGYSTTCLKPIDFNSRSRKTNACSQDNMNNISISSIFSNESDIEDSFDDIITISVEWSNGQTVTRKEFKLRKYQKLENIFDELAKIEGLPTSRILLMHNFNSVRPLDTPASLNFKFYGALTGSIAKTNINHDILHSDILDLTGEEKIEGLLKVKLQLESRQNFNLTIVKNQKLNVLYSKCSEELKCEESKIRLMFDGEFVEPNDLVSDLDIEDGDVFHVHIKQ